MSAKTAADYVKIESPGPMTKLWDDVQLCMSKAPDAITKDCKKFADAFFPGMGKSKQSKSWRLRAWRALDNNSNGHVSLAETGKWIQDTLISLYGSEEGKRLYKAYYPSYIRGFKDAADYGSDTRVKGTRTATTDDYVQFSEFRLMCTYLCMYGLMFDAFAAIDGGGAGIDAGDDRRLTPAEWNTGCKRFRGHPYLCLKIAAQAHCSAAKFKEMDADGKGKVLLVEFCQYIEAKEKEAKTVYGKILTAGE